ncbi:MAG: DUF4065 domain-containing protein [Chloroflexota bacterium]|nr:DUF4065 domain-containing protein [Chloroflexota bacterium]
MDTMFCPTCLAQTERHISRRREAYPVRGVPIEVDVDVPSCTQCGAEIVDPELEDAALRRAYDLYRRMHDIIRPEEIRKLREKYRLSQRAFARLLDWGVITIHRYETGALPDSVHSDLLVALQDEFTMADFLERHQDRLRPKESRRALEAASTARLMGVHELLSRIVCGKIDTFPDAARGNRQFDLDRLSQMMLYFTQPAGVVLTKLLKLLWYADFLAYKRLTVSLSGAVYRHYQFGPVPEEYRQLLDHAEREGFLQTRFESFVTEEGPKEGTVYDQAADFDPSLFTSDELAILETVRDRFASMHATAIVRVAHSEDAWRDTPEREIIPYERALALSLD